MVILFFYFFILVKSNLNIDATEKNKINIDGEIREFLLYYPKSLRKVKSQTKVPLWVILHGQSLNAETFYENTDLNLVAEDKKIVLLFAQGHCDYEYFCCWNTGHLRGFLDPDWSKDDIKYIDEIITQVFNYNPIDNVIINQDELIIMGYSSGAFMTHTYAINTTVHKIHTIISVAGHIGGNTYPWQPPPRLYDPNNFGVQGIYRPNVVVVFGDEDNMVRIEGGYDYYGRIDFSMQDDINFWKKENMCDSPEFEKTKYDMNDYLKLTKHGEYCDGKIISIIVKEINHYLIMYDKLFKNEELQQESFAKYSKTLSEFLYNIVETEIKEHEYPKKDPDPNPPTDDCYAFLPFYNPCKNNGCNNVYVLSLIMILITLFF